MKKNIHIIGFCSAVISFPCSAWALTVQCQGSDLCCSGGYTGYCCATGEQGFTENCPSGWTLWINGTCKRDDSSSEDSTGYYTVKYGSCEPSKEYYDCFERATPSSQSDCMKCQLDV